MSDRDGTCDACGEPLTEPYPTHRRWRCPEVTSRMDVRDAAEAVGLPRDTPLWKLLDWEVIAEEAGRHPVYPGGPDCQPNCPGPWSRYHEGYADGYERGEAEAAASERERIAAAACGHCQSLRWASRVA